MTPTTDDVAGLVAYLRQASTALYLTVDNVIADDLSPKLTGAAALLESQAKALREAEAERDAFRSKLAELCGKALAAVARLKEAEVALRFYACDGHWMLNGQCDPNSSRFEGPNVARAFLNAGEK